MPFQSTTNREHRVRETTYQGSGLRLAGEAYGAESDPPVILLHGGGQTRHAWRTSARTLAEHGWQTHAIDLRGHGDSDWSPDGNYTIDAFAADLVAVARTFDQPPVVVGASLGGLTSLIAHAETEPDNSLLAGIVLVDVAPRIEAAGVSRIGDFMTAHLDGFASLEEVADAVAAYNPHRPRPSDLSGLAKNVRQRDDGRWYWHWDPTFVTGKFGSADETRGSVLDSDRLQDAARSLTIPTLLVRGRMSDLLSEEGAQELLDLVPQARLVDVAGAGHMVAGDRNDLFNDAVAGFLDELRA
jgi:pimeloyl-ACP methyl ester carboxylesterase